MPAHVSTDVLTPSQLAFVAERLRNRSKPQLAVDCIQTCSSLVSLDGTLIPSQEFPEQTGYSGKYRAVGTGLLLLVDRAGVPLAISLAPGNYHDGARVPRACYGLGRLGGWKHKFPPASPTRPT